MKLRNSRKRLLFCLFSPALCWLCLAIRPSHAVKITVNVKEMYTCIFVLLVSTCLCEVSVESETWLVDYNAQEQSKLGPCCQRDCNEDCLHILYSGGCYIVK